ncbi:MAG: hypothetical protein JOZ68_05485 [Acidimicrobiia bacterium]|nr:hypothetical protein [Acidimicrobiia bacterium]MBV8986781.1 hypothetical protein [Acidimicrobiia bacterium]MBV9040432.1 hypothetical protein [Acidimicrobiia bacterium]
MVRRRRIVDDRADAAVAEDEVATRRSAVERPPWSPAQLIALAIGIIATVVGVIALTKTGIHSNAMDVVRSNGPLWQHTAWLAIGEIVFGLLMIGAGVIPGGARGLMTFLGILALAFGIAVMVDKTDLRTEDATGWAFIVAGALSLVAASISPVFFGGTRRAGYARRREVVA